MEGIASLSWILNPVEFSRTAVPLRGTADVGQGGAFRFSVPTAGIAGQQDLALTAVGKSGNKADFTVRLSRGESDLPSFSAVPADGKVTVTWDPDPFATRYDLAWVTGAAAPETGHVRQGVVSPAALDGLDNGSLYSVSVKIVYDDGSTGASSTARVIPLSAQTLAPTVRGDYQKIRVSWDSIPGAGSFDLWRSTSAGTGYARVAAGLVASAYVDSAVQFGKTYYYTVSPAGPNAPMSAASSGRSLAFPLEKIALSGKVEARDSRHVTVDGGYAFVASGASGVRIVDISSPENPVSIGLIDAADAWGVAVRGADGLLVADISAPRTPVLLGVRKTGDARAVALSGNYAYVADGDKGLKVIDVSDARALPRVGALDTVDAQDVEVVGKNLLVADGPGGFKVFDITRPAVTVLAATVSTSDARSLAVVPGLALVADGASGLRVIDLGDPRKPVLLSTLGGGPASSVSVDQGYAYLADAAGGVRVVDIEDPSHPSLFAAHASPGASGIDVRGRMACVVDGSSLQVMAVQIQGRSFRIASAATGGKAFGVSVSGNWAYVAGHGGGVTLVDVTDPSAVSDARVRSSLATRFAVSVSLQDKLAFVADGVNGLRILDVSPAWDTTRGAPPADVGAYRPGGTVNRVVPAGTFAWVAAGDQGVRVLDVRTPTAPLEVASLRTQNASDLVVSGSWAWLADGDGGVRVIDISTPSAPKLATARVQGNAEFLALSGTTLFAAGSAGVSIIDVSNPQAPVLNGRYDSRIPLRRGRVQGAQCAGRVAALTARRGEHLRRGLRGERGGEGRLRFRDGLKRSEGNPGADPRMVAASTIGGPSAAPPLP